MKSVLIAAVSLAAPALTISSVPALLDVLARYGALNVYTEGSTLTATRNLERTDVKKPFFLESFVKRSLRPPSPLIVTPEEVAQQPALNQFSSPEAPNPHPNAEMGIYTASMAVLAANREVLQTAMWTRAVLRACRGGCRWCH
ncbi:hypothetical protein BD626DRAFT_571273 [Schizophyllum amplum]|uniref:Uncharacterized protein n=1 Tax=Schizophyllum amplum TaxID=97359 RepID=A0A550C7V9_9AGAR|nr:hypothetical protein BD626DRAFT_571273 [Auriculariopsis ampla]